MNPLLWTWRDEWLILPVVRGWVGHLAAACAWLAAGCAVSAAAETAFGLLNVPMAALPCGLLSQAAAFLFFLLLVPLVLWCHIVLLTGRGTAFTRGLLMFVLVMTAAYAVCALFTLCTGEALLAQQGLLPLLLPILLQVCVTINLERMAAAPQALKAQAVAAPLLWLFAYVTDAPQTLLAAVLFKALLCYCVFVPLRQLAHYAPLIVSLPPRENSGEEEARDEADK